MFLPESDVLIMYIPFEAPSRSQLRQFHRNVLYLMESLGSKNVAIDLSKLKIMNIRNLKFLVGLNNYFKENGGSLVYYNLQPLIIKNLLQSGLYKFVSVVKNECKLEEHFKRTFSA